MACWPIRPSVNGENPKPVVFTKSLDVLVVSAQCRLNIGCGAIPEANPDNLRRMPNESTAVAEVDILGDDDETVVTGEVPQGRIWRVVKTQRLDVRGIRILVSKLVDKVRR